MMRFLTRFVLGKVAPAAGLIAGLTSCVSTDASPSHASAHPLMPLIQYVSVPENRAVRSSRSINVAYLHVKSDVVGIPTFVTFGGPGESILDYEDFDALTQAHAHLLEIGDVVFVEQRGVGASLPNLDCEPVRLPKAQPATEAALLDAHAVILGTCIPEVGADMRGYTTVEIAHDMEAIRNALEFDRINLSGGSYGAQQAYFYLRGYGERVHRAYLSQFLAPGASLALPSTIDSYVELIGDRVGPRFGMPENGGLFLKKQMRDVLSNLETNPVLVSVGETELVLGRTDLEIVTSLALRRTREALSLPAIYAGFAEGEFDLAAQAALQFYRDEMPVNASVLALDCAAQVLPSRQERFNAEVEQSLTGRGAHLPFPSVCQFMDHGDVGPQYNVAGSIPSTQILFVQGELDPRARDENLSDLLSLAPRARLVVIENASHDLGVSVSDAMLQNLRMIEAAFLKTGNMPNKDDSRLKL